MNMRERESRSEVDLVLVISQPIRKHALEVLCYKYEKIVVKALLQQVKNSSLFLIFSL